MTFVVNTVRYFMPRGDGADVALNPVGSVSSARPALAAVARYRLFPAELHSEKTLQCFRSFPSCYRNGFIRNFFFPHKTKT